ncbi:30S ribosomal protein S3 [Candidatus Wolfebacteria bacterium]|nr:30S ribosomal protein S3 [Candidatus Wolfebacteria bacterium]
MGNKIKPNSLRLGIMRGWQASWFPRQFRFKDSLREDELFRSIINEKIKSAGIDSIRIERTGAQYRITVKVQRPGLVIGRGGRGVEELTKFIERRLRRIRRERGEKSSFSFSLDVEELKRSEISAAVLAQSIAWDLEKRLPFRRTVKRYLEQTIQNREVKGAKIQVAGRLDGGEIARTEHFERGKLPLQTLRADIDYGQATAYTTFGTIGIKTWIYKGEKFKE